MAKIEIRGVSKVFRGNVRALDGLNLDVADGELLAVVGPSGSGKTTLLRLIAGLDCPTEGSIRLAGRDLGNVPPRHRDVALVFQSLALYGHLTVKQNLAFGLNARKGGWWGSRRDSKQDGGASEKVGEVARLLKIENLLDRRPADLSGGQQQRVALGRAIVRRPAALLLDEPLSSLDLPLRRELRREIKDMQRQLGVATVYVTHDQAEALAVGDRIAVLDGGRLAQAGSPHEIYDHPRNRFVAGFFGSQGMNFIEGEILNHISYSQLTGGKIARPPVAGIRPEHIQLIPEGTTETPAASGEVVATENLGESRYLHVRLISSKDDGGAKLPRLTIRLSDHPHQPPPPGALVQLSFPANRIHWFCPTTGERLEKPPPNPHPNAYS